ncbi:hypothetical protein C0J52_08197 [Blattella germanica]|nr:hypothetical protein C0J52_08197 [Blattella germanica]
MYFQSSFQYHDYMDRKAPKATKSLDNIFARQLTGGRDEQGSPFLWRDATRSEEHLYSGSLQQSEPASQPSTPSRFSVARSRISALIKKLSPRPFHKAVPATSSCPWVIVEFANQDLESPIVSGRTSSITSDHSFDLAVRANRLRKEKMVHGSEEQIHKKSGVSTHVLDIRHQSHIPQVSSVGADRHSKHDEQRRYRLTTGLATKHRPAFNTG